jgi:hypothetical protein
VLEGIVVRNRQSDPGAFVAPLIFYRAAWVGIGGNKTPNSCGPKFGTLEEALNAMRDFNAERVARGIQPCTHIQEFAPRPQREPLLGPFQGTALFQVDTASMSCQLVDGKPRRPLPVNSRWVVTGLPA